jgi:hypothetical protein
MSNEEINILIQILENAREMEPGSNPRAAFLTELFFMVSDKMRPETAPLPVAAPKPKQKRNWSPERRERAAERMRAMLAKKRAAAAAGQQ